MGKRKGGNKGGNGKDKKRQRCHALIEPGQYGIFASCARFKEVAAAKEMRLLLNDAIEKKYPKEEREKAAAEDEEEEEPVEEKTPAVVNIEDEIAKELLELKKQDDRSKINKNNKDLILREIPLGVESLTFFKLKQPVRPSKLVISLCEDLMESGTKTGRFVQKLVPIDKSCNATQVEFEKLFDLTLDSLIEDDHENDADKVKVIFETYNVNLVKRNFDTISRDEFMETIKRKLDERFGEGWCRLNYKGAQTLINIYCFKNNIGMSIIPNEAFERLSKFNVQQIFDKSHKDEEPPKVVEEAAKEPEETEEVAEPTEN